MSSKKGGRQYSGQAPNMRRGGAGSNKKSKGKGKQSSTPAAAASSSSSSSSKKSSGRVRPARAQNAFGYDDDAEENDTDVNQYRYDADATASREYKLPENFEDEDLDSDEEGIFDEEDEEKYGDVFAKSTKKSPKGGKGKASHASTEDDDESVEVDGDEDDEDEEDLSGYEGAQTMNLSDMLDMDTSKYGEEDEDAPPTKKAKKGQQQAPPAKLTKQQLKMLQEAEDEEEDEEDEEELEQENGHSVDNEDEMSIDEDEDIDEDAEDGEEAHKGLLNFVQGLGATDSEGASSSKKGARGKKRTEERTELFDENQFSIPRVGSATNNGTLKGGLKLGDLLKKTASVTDSAEGDSTTLSALRKQFNILTNSHTQTLVEPLAEVRQDAMTRAATYTQTKEEVAKWAPIINKHRDQSTLKFPLYDLGRQHTSTSELTTKFVPSADSSLESDLKNLMSTYGLKESQLKNSEAKELEHRNFTVEETTKREEQLAKMKSLLFYEEIKAKRVKKIKSKSYHRLKKKMREKNEMSMEEMKQLDPEQYEAEQRKAEQRRIEERMSLQHSTSSKWMQKQLRLNTEQQGANTDIKEMMKTHAAKAATLKQKQESYPKEKGEDGEDQSSDSEDHMDADEDDDQDADLDSEEEDDPDDPHREVKREARKAKIASAHVASIRAKLRALESELNENEESQEPAGFDQTPGSKPKEKVDKSNRLVNLKFMQSAAAKKREEVRAMIREYEAELEMADKREQLRRENIESGGAPMDEDELDQLVLSSTTSADGMSGLKDITIGRRTFNAQKSANLPVVRGVEEAQVKLLPNTLQSAAVAHGKGMKSKVSGPIAVTAPKSSTAASAALTPKNAHPGQHHSVHGKSTAGLDTPFVSKAQSEALFPMEKFSDDEEEEKKSSVNTNNIKLQQSKKGKNASSIGVKAAPEESNPWANALTSNPRKALRAEEITARTKKTQQKGKSAAVTMEDADENGMAEDNDDDDDDNDDEQGGIDADLTGPLALHARRAAGGFDLLSGGGLDQSELVRRAFSNAEDDATAAAAADDGEDDPDDDFARMKREAMEEDMPKEEKTMTGVPGWGSWGGIGAVQHKSAGQLAKETAERRARDSRRAAALSARKDAKLKHVLINEKVDQKAIKYQVATLPYPYTSQEAYEKSLLTPIGKEWNTTSSFQDNIRPKIITKIGEIIDPIKFNPKVGAAGRKEKQAKQGEKQPKKISGSVQVGQKRKR